MRSRFGSIANASRSPGTNAGRSCKAIASAICTFIALFACASFGTALTLATAGKAADDLDGENGVLN